MSRTAGPAGTSALVILSWENTSLCGLGQYVTDQTSLRVAHLSGGVWANEGYLSSTGSNASGTITSDNSLTTFSPFALASSISSENPLPILFADLKAYEKNNGVQLEWTNLTEKDVVDYVIERAEDGKNFKAIGMRLPVSNSGEKISCNLFDATPRQGLNFYRIKMLETSGRSFYSKIMNVNLGTEKESLVIYPNPVTGGVGTLRLSGLKAGRYNVQLVNMAGQKVSNQTLIVTGSAFTQTLDFSALKSGVYSIVVTGNTFRESRPFVVQ